MTTLTSTNLLLASILVLLQLAEQAPAQNTPKPYELLPSLPTSELGLLMKSSGIDTDEEAREEILNSMRLSQDNWNAGDLDGFMHNYWHSDSLMFIGKSGITYGWDATLKRYKTSYPDKSKQGTLTFDFIHLDKLSEDAWFQVGKYTLTREKETLTGHFTLLWRKIDGRWRIVADHSS